ncbi:unnamed protein product [Phyllotreta striolata]|uniref:Uncharacterized protein n=1 Tax=Phyllotreta striolata TaxID=444603 RepID=A0A9N9TND2_PHYSR|nr:unnamed protein product [Phyllotreta striolata]
MENANKVQLNYSKISKRFDFGVPLEDIFDDRDLHPRLKLVFQNTFELYKNSGLNVDVILNQNLSLEDCLRLKQSIILDRHPVVCTYQPVGAYFWIIRHFLGLLPLPLLPPCTSTRKYSWRNLSSKCRNVLKSKPRYKEDCNSLNYLISSSLNSLPNEHIMLLNAVVIFLRKILKVNLSKTIFRTLISYYCDAVFIRPFKPGNDRATEDFIPLFVYLVNKWYKIVKHLKTTQLPLFATGYTYAEINPPVSQYLEPIRAPYVVVNRYVRDSECQTDYWKTRQSISTTTPNDILFDEVNSQQDVLRIYPAKSQKLSSFIGTLDSITEDGEPAGFDYSYERLYDFDSTIDDPHLKWDDVVAEIRNTVERIESYNYESDRYSSILEFDSTSSSFRSGTDYISFTDSSSGKGRETAPPPPVKRKSSGNLDTSMYLSFCTKSDEELYALDDSDAEDTVSNFSLKKLIFNFKFLKSLSPKLKRSKGIFRSSTNSNVKYKRFRF